MSVWEIRPKPEPKTEQTLQTGRKSVCRIEALWVAVSVGVARPQLLANALQRETVGEPYAGNPHVRLDEGEGSSDEWSAYYLPRCLKGFIYRKLVT